MLARAEKKPLINKTKEKRSYTSINEIEISPCKTFISSEINTGYLTIFNHVLPYVASSNDIESLNETLELRKVSKQFKQTVDSMKNFSYQDLENNDLVTKKRDYIGNCAKIKSSSSRKKNDE